MKIDDIDAEMAGRQDAEGNIQRPTFNAHRPSPKSEEDEEEEQEEDASVRLC